MTPMVKAEQVCKSFGALQVLKGITLEVGKGEVLVHGRPVRLGQVDVPALHQPPGDRSTRAGCTSTVT